MRCTPSAANDSASDNKAGANRDALAGGMSRQDIAAGQELTRKMAGSGKVLKVLDRYLVRPARALAGRTAGSLPVAAVVPAQARGPWPARPARVPGVVSCRTQCVNGDCYRTYDDGRKIHFHARQKWDPFQNTFTFDSGSC